MKKRFLIVAHEKREIGERYHTAYKRKFDTLEQARAVAEEVQAGISDVYGFSHVDIFDLEYDDSTVYDCVTGYDGSKSFNKETFDANKFLKERGLI